MMRGGARSVVGAGVWVGGGLLAWNLGNYVFFVAAGRLLGPGDYGLVAALLAAVLVLSVPFTALQPALASAGGVEAPAGLYTRALRVGAATTAAGLVVATAAILISAALAPSVPRGPLLASLLVLVPAVVYPLTLGRLQAQHRFAGYGVAIGALGIPRPMFLALFWVAGAGLYAPLIGSAATTIAALALGLALTRDALRARPVPASDPAWRRYRGSLAASAGGVSAIAMLTNVDVIVARLALDDHRAGLFAAAAAIAKAVFLVPQAIATVLLPRIVARAGAGRATGRVLLGGVAVTLLAGASAALLAVPIGEEVMRLTFGEDFAEAGVILPPFMAAMTLMGTLIVLLYHQMGRGDGRCAAILLVAAGAQVVLLALFHGSTDAILAVDAVVALGAIVAYEVVYTGTGEGLLESLRPRSGARVDSEPRGDEHELTRDPDD